MDYTTLSKTIKSYVENSFPATIGADSLTSDQQIATFVEQAEQRIYNTVQFLELRKNVTGTMTIGNPYLSTPSDWLANYSVAVIDQVTGAYDYLNVVDVSYIRAAYPIPTQTGKPQYYAMFDENSYILGPTPNYAYSTELHYFYYPESITTSGTSWLGDNFDMLLLYGSLLEAYTYMKGEEDVMKAYQQRYDDAMALAINLAAGKNRTDMYRTRQFSVAPK